jgi:hypothetical protein
LKEVSGGDKDEEGAGEEDGRSLPVLHMVTSELEKTAAGRLNRSLTRTRTLWLCLIGACVETSPPFGLLHRGEACHGPIYIYTRARVGSTCLPLGALGWAVRTELLRLGIPGGRRKGMAYWHVRAVGTNGIRDSSVVFLPYLTPCWHASREGDGHAETAAVAAAVATQYASPFSVSIPWPATARPFLPTPFFCCCCCCG